MIEEELVVSDVESSRRKKSSRDNNLLDQAENDREERERKQDEEEERREEAEDNANAKARAMSAIPWNYVKFHAAMTLASLYVCMLFTGWGELTNEANAFKHDKVTVWVNILTQWACFVFYIWTLVAMAMCPERLRILDD
eukprot:TRINITY_DN4888_c0_g1_i1.p1 TRINITY_DN4888_c0_g1~~TRINITY_DN4888_c0_g1_i1.p1  ORF type:complete len:140 (+),score=26.98 TRINITY_DN4888_c0_g1_i1:71-490(+)